jgi:DNA-binding Lrp family transcriptional regulator
MLCSFSTGLIHVCDFHLCLYVSNSLLVANLIREVAKNGKTRISLSDIDRKILKVLLTPNGRISSKVLAKRLGIPQTTLQRRRKRLEKELLKITYSLDVEKFGWHKVDFLIATESGKTDIIAKDLLKREEVIYAGKSIGQHTIDLRVETILKDNGEILRMMQLLKAIDGIKEVIWTEIVQVVGMKTSVPAHIIDKL